jgi:hypothetical protein
LAAAQIEYAARRLQGYDPNTQAAPSVTTLWRAYILAYLLGETGRLKLGSPFSMISNLGKPAVITKIKSAGGIGVAGLSLHDGMHLGLEPSGAVGLLRAGERRQQE